MFGSMSSYSLDIIIKVPIIKVALNTRWRVFILIENYLLTSSWYQKNIAMNFTNRNVLFFLKIELLRYCLNVKVESVNTSHLNQIKRLGKFYNFIICTQP